MALVHQVYHGFLSQKIVIRLFLSLSCTMFFCTRGEKIEKLCGVMGVEWPYDPDYSYELTTDNLKKILAIHMRFR